MVSIFTMCLQNVHRLRVDSMDHQGSGTSRGMERRCLTVPGVGKGNDGFDNDNNDLILYVDDVLFMKERRCVAFPLNSVPVRILLARQTSTRGICTSFFYTHGEQ